MSATPAADTGDQLHMIYNPLIASWSPRGTARALLPPLRQRRRLMPRAPRFRPPPRIMAPWRSSANSASVDTVLEQMHREHAEVQQTMASFGERLAARDAEIASRLDQVDPHTKSAEARMITMEGRLGHVEEQLRRGQAPQSRDGGPDSLQVIVIGGWPYDTATEVIRADAAAWLSARGYRHQKLWIPGPRNQLCKVRFPTAEAAWALLDDGPQWGDRWFSIERT